MRREDHDYGKGGRLGLGTPQANPTVEPEMRRLIPGDVEYYTVRLTSASTDPRQRLVDYLLDLPAILERYAALELDGFMFACTASSYLVDAAAAGDALAAASDVIHAPVHTAAAALEHWLRERDAARIGLVSPYPDWLNADALAYWQRAGFDVVTSDQVDIGGDDTYGIYSLTSNDARATITRFADLDVDALVVSGTGMPSLAVVAELTRRGVDVVSSNIALADLALATLGRNATWPAQTVR